MSEFHLNPRALLEIEESAEMQDELHNKAERVAEEARAAAPVLTGTYRGSIRAEGNEVVTDDPKWPYIEFGTEDTPTFAPLRRGLEAARE